LKSGSEAKSREHSPTGNGASKRADPGAVYGYQAKDHDWRSVGPAITTGLDQLAKRGARRLKVGYATEAARRLYAGAGFQVTTTSTSWSAQRNGTRSDARRVRR
jgi:hypothetical protein